MTLFFCATCGPVELDIHGRCGICASDNVSSAAPGVIVAGAVSPAREQLTGIEKQERTLA